MILRRFGSALKRRDWTAVTVELVVLVAGILGALAMDAWWQERYLEQFRSIRERVDDRPGPLRPAG